MGLLIFVVCAGTANAVYETESEAQCAFARVFAEELATRGTTMMGPVVAILGWTAFWLFWIAITGCSGGGKGGDGGKGGKGGDGGNCRCAVGIKS